MDETMSFGAWLRRCRMTRGLTQRVFAEHLGYAFSTYRKLEADERRPSSGFLERLADYIEVSAAERAILLMFGQTGVCACPQALLQQTVPAPPTPPQPPPDARLILFPRSPTSLIGRQHDLSELVGMLRQPARRLITLVGPPGVGKTHLALHALAALAASESDFADGMVFIPLATCSSPERALLSIARTLDLAQTRQPSFQALSTFLRDQSLLLVLDNLEQVLDIGPALAELLAMCPRLTILATSRAPLKILAEQQFAVPPLAVPDPAQPPEPAQLAETASVALFVARAQATQRTFQLTVANSAAIAALCARLDGLPLALELAAAHVKLFSPAALMATNWFDLLTDGPRDLPVCQQSLRAAIERSYLLLTPPQQALFARLSVFARGATFAAISAICADQEPPLQVVHAVSQLIDQNLVWGTAGFQQRVFLLETIRMYAWEQLIARGEHTWMQERHASYYSGWGSSLAAHIRSTRRAAVMQELEDELDNLRAALHWCFAHPAYVETGARLASNLYPFWWGQGYLSEGRGWLEKTVAALEQCGAAHILAPGEPTHQQPASELYAQALRSLDIIATLQGAPLEGWQEEEPLPSPPLAQSIGGF